MSIQEIFNENAKKWFSDNGDVYKRLDYPELGPDSIVFDIGGYLGSFTESIYLRYQCNVYLFEPVKSFYEACNFKFLKIPKIKTFQYGLSSTDSMVPMYIDRDASSTSIIDKSNSSLIEVRNVCRVIKELNIKSVDLMKINIEGDEFPLLENLILDKGILSMVKNIQIQYHTFANDAQRRRERINSRLISTHECNWCYEWVWENWKIKS